MANCRGPIAKGEFTRTVNLTDGHFGWVFTTSVCNNARVYLIAALNLAVEAIWEVRHTKTDDYLRIAVFEVIDEIEHHLGHDPGLQKEGVEKHLQELLADHVEVLGDGLTLLRREYPTAIGPIDLLLRHPSGGTVAVEVKRRGELDGVEQLGRYVELLDRDPHLRPVTGLLAAQEIKPQARTLATDRGFDCVVVDYNALRGLDDPTTRLF